jgi:hypothetical protein
MVSVITSSGPDSIRVCTRREGAIGPRGKKLTLELNAGICGGTA